MDFSVERLQGRSLGLHVIPGLAGCEDRGAAGLFGVTLQLADRLLRLPGPGINRTALIEWNRNLGVDFLVVALGIVVDGRAFLIDAGIEGHGRQQFAADEANIVLRRINREATGDHVGIIPGGHLDRAFP